LVPQLARRIADSPYFQNAILAVIGLASILVGLETFNELTTEHHDLFSTLDAILLAVFTAEVVIRIGAYGRRPWEFFRDGWNVFDFVTVAIFYLPFMGSEVALLRLARVVRMLRLVKAVPGLRMLVVALLHSLPSIGYIGLLLLIELYVYAVLGSFLFGETDQERFGNFAVAMQTLMQVITFDDWAAIMRAQANQGAATVYFVSFILLGTMVILNLFIGVIMEGFGSARAQFAEERRQMTAAVMAERDEVEAELERIQGQLASLATDVHRLMQLTQRSRNGASVSPPRTEEERVREAARL
jgi:voltage-gated sodium channel